MKKRRDDLYISLILIFLFLLLISKDLHDLIKGLAKWEEVWLQGLTGAVFTGLAVLVLRIPLVQKWLDLR
jgi:nucleoside recognition membrane protein YjiH